MVKLHRMGGLVVLVSLVGLLLPSVACAQESETLSPQAVATWEAPGASVGRITHSSRAAWVKAMDAPLEGANGAETSPNPCFEPCAPVCDPCADPCGPNCWEFDLTLGSWISGMSGTMTLGGRRLEVDTTPADLIENFGDLLEKLEFMISGQLNARYGRWTLSLGGMYIGVGDEIPFREGGLVTANMDLDIAIWQFNVAYCLGRCPTGACSSLKYDVYAGVRGYHQSIDLRTPLPAVDQSESWADPVVGVHGVWTLSPKWWLQVQADVGGFGIGSDLSYLVKLGAGWRFARKWDLRFGWNIVDVDYASGGFGWDMTFYGPYLGVTYRF